MAKVPNAKKYWRKLQPPE